MSDHEGMAVIDTDIRPNYSRTKPGKINIFSKANWDQIQKDTAKFRFDYLKNHTLRSVNTNWTLFKNHVQAMLSKYVPSKQLSTRHNLPWFHKKAKFLVRLKQKIYNRAKLTGNTNDWQKYRNVKKSTNHHLKRSHRHHVNSKLSDALENKTFLFVH